MTSIPNHSVLPATSSDLPTIANFVRASKLSLTVNQFLYNDWPNEAAQLAQSTQAVEGGFRDPNSETFKVVNNSSGDIVGHLVLSRKTPEPEAATKSNPHQGTVPDGMDPEFFAVIVKAASTIVEPMKDRDHLMITHMYVKPSSRRQGIGSGLVTLALQKAKEASVPCFISAEPQARPLYLKLGFKDTEHFDIDLREYVPENCGFGVFRISGMINSS